MQSYFGDRVEEARGIADHVTDNPAVAGAVVAGATALSLHPKGRIALEALSMAGSLGGTGYIVHDVADGIVHGTPIGEHHLTAGLAMWGGAGTLRGMTIGGFINPDFDT